MTRHPVRLVVRLVGESRSRDQLPLRFRARISLRLFGVDSDVDSDGLMDGFDEEDRAGLR
jgi:hypothetical protein